MGALKPGQLAPGMVLTADVLSREGRILFPAGTRLEPWHIQLLQGLDLDEVRTDREPGTPPPSPGEVLEYARSFFLYVNPDQEALQALFEIAAARALRRVDEGWRLPGLDERRAAGVEHLADVFLADEGRPEKIVEHETALSSFPDIYFRLKAELEAANSSMPRIAEIIGGDVALSAKILRLANSPFYGFAVPVDTVSRAVTLIGTNELATLALGITAINYFKDIPPELIDMQTFWRHSLTCGVLAKLLTRVRPNLNRERFFTAGLLHDVGRLLLFKNMPYASSEAMIFARENGMPLVEAERLTLEFIHTDISAYLLKEWNFPVQFRDLINRHHAPMEAPEPLEAAVVHLADVMANALGVAEGGMYAVPSLDEEAWRILGLKPADLHAVADEFDAQYEKTVAAFF